jgi:hypothetical protein
MRPTFTKYPRGSIVISLPTMTRYSEFWLSLEALQVPDGTYLATSIGADIPRQLNEAIRRSTEAKWFWILGDDHTFDPGMLLRLLDRALDVVVPIVPHRRVPFGPVLMHGPYSDDGMTPYQYKDLPIEGLYKLPKGDVVGTAGMLVRRHVMDKIGDPWFEGGQLHKGELQEDVYFVHRLHELGIPIHIDCDELMGHMAQIEIRPQRRDDRLYPTFAGTPTSPWVALDFES